MRESPPIHLRDSGCFWLANVQIMRILPLRLLTAEIQKAVIFLYFQTLLTNFQHILDVFLTKSAHSVHILLVTSEWVGNE